MTPEELVAYYEAGSDLTPRDETVAITPGQLWYALLSIAPERRLAKLAFLLGQSDVASECMRMDHRGRIEQLDDRLARLEGYFADGRRY